MYRCHRFQRCKHCWSSRCCHQHQRACPRLYQTIAAEQDVVDDGLVSGAARAAVAHLDEGRVAVAANQIQCATTQRVTIDRKLHSGDADGASAVVHGHCAGRALKNGIARLRRHRCTSVAVGIGPGCGSKRPGTTAAGYAGRKRRPDIPYRPRNRRMVRTEIGLGWRRRCSGSRVGEREARRVRR